MRRFTSGEMMEITGLSRNGLIHFERSGLINPLKNSENGYRFYDIYDIERIMAYKFNKGTKLPLPDSVELLNNFSVEDTLTKARQEYDKLLREQKLLEMRAALLQEQIQDLSAFAETPDKILVEVTPSAAVLINQDEDGLFKDLDIRQLTKAWGGIYAARWSCIIPLENLLTGNMRYLFGYTILEEYMELMGLEMGPGTGRIPQSLSLKVILRADPAENFGFVGLNRIFEEMEKMELIPAGDGWGRVLHARQEPDGRKLHYLMRFPVKEKNN